MKKRRPIKNEQRWGMRFNLTDGGMQVEFPKGVHAELLINGALQAEFGLGAEGPEDLRRELIKARASQAACSIMAEVLRYMQEQYRKPDHRIKSKNRSVAFAAGLEVGLEGRYRVIGKDPMHNIRGSVVAPEHKLSGPSYHRGWDVGIAIYSAVYMSKHGEDPRDKWKS